MVQLAGFVDKDNPQFVCKLEKEIYGLKQTPWAWYKELSGFLFQVQFHNSIADASLFVYKEGTNIIYFLVYMGVLIVIGNNQAFVKEFVEKLSNHFSLKDLGK